MTKVYSKRFCVDCDGERGIYIVQHKRYAMYHCCECKQEVARVGDVRGEARPSHILGGRIAPRGEDEFAEGLQTVDRATANPDVLSDEHSMWPHRSEEATSDREDALRTLTYAMAGLTSRQRQVLEAVRLHKSQTKAASHLRISQPVVKKTLDAIRKKLEKNGIKVSSRGRE